MTTKDNDVLLHIIRHCDRVREDVEMFGDTFDDFEAIAAFRDSVCMNILQIGELAGKLSDDFVARTNNIVPWGKIQGMRNRFAHDYGSTDDVIIWNAVTIEIPQLRSFCEQWVKSFEQERTPKKYDDPER